VLGWFKLEVPKEQSCGKGGGGMIADPSRPFSKNFA